jgi:hypothetical protein
MRGKEQYSGFADYEFFVDEVLAVRMVLFLLSIYGYKDVFGRSENGYCFFFFFF